MHHFVHWDGSQGTIFSTRKWIEQHSFKSPGYCYLAFEMFLLPRSLATKSEISLLGFVSETYCLATWLRNEVKTNQSIWKTNMSLLKIRVFWLLFTVKHPTSCSKKKKKNHKTQVSYPCRNVTSPWFVNKKGILKNMPPNELAELYNSKDTNTL